MNGQVWFVTGASRGIGRAIVEEALSRGDRVVAAARTPGDVLAWLPPHADDRVLVVPLDVTSAGQRARAVGEAIARFGSIDVLVNNAGYGYFAAIEEGDDDAIRALFDANFFGLAALVREALPGMRARGRGAIVNISSVSGFIGLAGSGYYAASKFAVEGLSEALRREVAPLGLRVLLVEPGPFRTDWAGSSLRHSAVRIDDYEATAGRRRQDTVAASGRQAGDPARAARVIADAVAARDAPFRLPLGRIALAALRDEIDAVKDDIGRWADRGAAADAPLEQVILA